mmetsp:Transcript_69317/g.196435  ORF Transcript_69317/g.196435 Transcript_69317/m.196435 type:complete len:104 (-) Transcript_69317:485-796(-)
MAIVFALAAAAAVSSALAVPVGGTLLQRCPLAAAGDPQGATPAERVSQPDLQDPCSSGLQLRPRCVLPTQNVALKSVERFLRPVRTSRCNGRDGCGSCPQPSE